MTLLDRHGVLTRGAVAADSGLVTPLFQFRTWGQQLPYRWSTIANGAAFGTES